MNDDRDDSAQPSAPIPDDAGKVAVEVAVTAADELSLPFPSDKPGDQPAVVSGAVWTVGGFAFMQVLRFVLSPIVTRLVSQHVFGVINLANLFIQGLHMFSDLGIRQCVVNSSRGEDPTFLNTAWTLQVMRGSVLWVMTLKVFMRFAEPTLRTSSTSKKIILISVSLSLSRTTAPHKLS